MPYMEVVTRTVVRTHLMRDVVGGKLLQHLLGLSLNDALPGFPSTSRAVLGLDREDGVQTTLGGVALVTGVGGEGRGGERGGGERGGGCCKSMPVFLVINLV